VYRQQKKEKAIYKNFYTKIFFQQLEFGAELSKLLILHPARKCTLSFPKFSSDSWSRRDICFLKKNQTNDVFLCIISKFWS